jgi:hypothetical protein
VASELKVMAAEMTIVESSGGAADRADGLRFMVSLRGGMGSKRQNHYLTVL